MQQGEVGVRIAQGVDAVGKAHGEGRVQALLPQGGPVGMGTAHGGQRVLAGGELTRRSAHASQVDPPELPTAALRSGLA